MVGEEIQFLRKRVMWLELAVFGSSEIGEEAGTFDTVWVVRSWCCKVVERWWPPELYWWSS